MEGEASIKKYTGGIRITFAENVRPFNKAVEEIGGISGGALQMSFEYDNINTFLAGKMTVGADDTVQGCVHKIEKTCSAKALEGEKKRKKKSDKAE